MRTSICALLILGVGFGLLSTAVAQWQPPLRGYWPFGCRTVSGTSCGTLDGAASPWYSENLTASNALVYCLPDSLVAPQGYVFGRIDVWNQSRDMNVLQELTLVARLFDKGIYWYQGSQTTVGTTANINVYSSTWHTVSSATASWNTSLYLSAMCPDLKTQTGGTANVSWTFPITTSKVWLKASGATANWGWCGYCVPTGDKTSGATEATIYFGTSSTISTIRQTSLAQPYWKIWQAEYQDD